MKRTIETIQRVTIICTPDQRHEVLDWLHARGYETIRIGPKRLNVGMVSTTEYEIVFENPTSVPVSDCIDLEEMMMMTSVTQQAETPKSRVGVLKPRLRIHIAADPHAISAALCGVDIGPWLQEWRQGIIDGHPMWKLTLIVHPHDIEFI